MAGVAELLALFGGGIIANMLAQKWKVPSAIPLLLFGVIIGPEILHIISINDISIFADLGKVLMLFMIGWTFDINKISHRLVSTLLLLTIKFFFVFIVSYEVLLLFGTPEASIIGMAIAFSSTAFFASFVREYKLAGKEEANMLIALLVLEDIAAVFLLSYLSTTHEMNTLENVLRGILYSIVPLVIAYFLVKFVIDHLVIKLRDGENTLVMFALALAGLFAYITSLAGFDPATGAFLAGNITGASQRMKKTEDQLNLITNIFFMVFILSVGVSISLSFILENLALIVALTLFNTGAKMLSVSTGLRLMGRHSTSEWGIMMGITGEFSLIVATAVKGFDAISLVASMIFLSSVIAGLAYSRKDSIEELKKVYPISVYTSMIRKASQHFSRMVSIFEFSGEFWRSADVYIRNAVISFLFLLVMSALLIAGGIAAVFFEIYDNISVLAILIAIIVMPVIYRLLSSISKLLDFIGSSLRLDQEEWKVRVVRDVIFLFILMSISVILMFIAPVMDLPPIMSRAYLIPLLIGVIIVWDTLRAFEHGILQEKKRSYIEKRKNARVEKILEEIPFIGTGRSKRIWK
ncbi:MAG: cation:proton antiporter [Candidatus Anstonellales archaeon]